MIFTILEFALRPSVDFPALNSYIANVESNNTLTLLRSVTPSKRTEGPEY